MARDDPLLIRREEGSVIQPPEDRIYHCGKLGLQKITYRFPGLRGIIGEFYDRIHT
jgi:hypothetical protein